MHKQNNSPSSGLLTGAQKVRAFFDALVAGGDARSLEFRQILLQNYGQFIQQSIPDADDLSEYELLLEIARWALETELVDTLQQFERKEINKKEFSALCASFWGALMLHIELFLRQPPVSGQAVITEIGGEYRVGLDGRPAYTFQDPFSTSKIKYLVTTLGNAWLIRYLECYILNKKIPVLYQLLDEKQVPVFRWVEDKTPRWLNKAQAALCTKLWAMQSSHTSVTPPIGREVLVRNMIALTLDQSRIGQVIAAQEQIAIQDEFFAAYAKKLDEFLSSQEKPPSIVPDIQVEDEQGYLLPASLEDVAGIQGFCLLAGLPGGGKSRVQAWVARKRLTENLGIDIFLDLREYVKSGIASPYEFAADQLIRSLDITVGLVEMSSFLIELDRKKMLFWHVENWDRVYEHEQERCLTSIKGLYTAIVSVEYPQGYVNLTRKLGIDLPQQVFHLPRWDNRDVSLFIERYSSEKPDFTLSNIQSLRRQLPGLASLPAGLRFIVENDSLSIVELIIKFLGAQQTARGSSPVALSIQRSNSIYQFDWGNPFVNQAYEIVSAILRRGPVREFTITRLERMDAINLGSQLILDGGNLDARIKKGEMGLIAGCQSGLLYRVSLSSYAFVIPEVGYLLAAAAVYASNFIDFTLHDTYDELRYNQEDAPNRILLSFAELASKKGRIVNTDVSIRHDPSRI